jgi:hypothetical protein
MSKNVPAGISKSVAVSLWSRPAMSGQYSSAVAPDGLSRARASSNATSRRNALERTCSRSPCLVVTTAPSGSVIRTGVSARRPVAAGCRRPGSRRSCPTSPGFLAPPTFPVERYTMANCRSPQQPAVCNLGGVQLLAHRGLHRIAPQRRNGANPEWPGRRRRRIGLHDAPRGASSITLSQVCAPRICCQPSQPRRPHRLHIPAMPERAHAAMRYLGTSEREATMWCAEVAAASADQGGSHPVTSTGVSADGDRDRALYRAACPEHRLAGRIGRCGAVLWAVEPRT